MKGPSALVLWVAEPSSIMKSIVLVWNGKGGVAVVDEQEKGTEEVMTFDESVRISNDVLAVIAGIAAEEIDGIAGMSGGLVDSLSEKFGRQDHRRGVKVETEGQNVVVSLHISVDYGIRIPEVARLLQANVKDAIENMTDLKVKAVNVHVQEVLFSVESKEAHGTVS